MKAILHFILPAWSEFELLIALLLKACLEAALVQNMM
jgi:hypothetical protein